MKDEDGETKKENAMKLVYDTLKHLNIEISEQEKQLIEIGIESAVNMLPKGREE
ncbi:hypothetical protein [Paenibacillus popilliae]|uniref:Uncharacterized protein n=1 Tax=Paenibacillus popilliae ATCC 14706 TaxID=1212764 RepID=M9LRR7_PAEPP|nr:hypothetical protein [Paenibacillus popilliae]GAC44191.1 hypothetical protein PPOP_3594 [Paenibacillus popilliae ATCC 14706]